jgi:hypothetical protein
VDRLKYFIRKTYLDEDMEFFALAFVAGLLVKAVDWMDDERKTAFWAKLPLALVYGLVIGLTISQASFGLLFLGALLAQILARKVDTISHKIGFLVALVVVAIFGFPQIDLLFLVYFMLLAFLDEEDYIGKLRPLVEYRPFLKVGSFLLVFFGRYDYFLGIILFDIGYELFSFVAKGMAKAKSIKAKKKK